MRTALRRTTDPKRRLRRTIDTYVRFIEDHEELYDFLMHRSGTCRASASSTTSRDCSYGFFGLAAELALARESRLRPIGSK